MKIIIDADQQGQRLDSFLVAVLDKKHDLSRSQIQKLIKEEKIKLNEKAVSPHKKLQLEDEVEILSFTLGEKVKSTSPEWKGLSLDWKKIVLAETDDYLVLNKPAGIITHGSEHIKGQNMADELLKKWPQLRGVGEDPWRPGIVHRLDKEASGLMIVAKNQESFIDLKKQFKNREVRKHYQALVYGAIEREKGEIDFPISRSESGHKMAALPKTFRGEENEKGKYAETSFETISSFINFTLLKVKIKTGRTHQIRVHLSATDHPVVGDDVYGQRKAREKNKKYNLGRIFLVASNLSFNNMDGQRQNFEIELPDNLKEFLKIIK